MEELKSAAPYALDIGFDAYSYYWTITEEQKLYHATKQFKEPDLTVGNKSFETYIGESSRSDYYPFDSHEYTSSRPVTAQANITTQEVNRKTTVDYSYSENTFTLFRPSTRKSFYVRRYALVGSKAVLSGDVKETTSRPTLAGYRSWSAFLGQATGTAPVFGPRTKDRSAVTWMATLTPGIWRQATSRRIALRLSVYAV